MSMIEFRAGKGLELLALVAIWALALYFIKLRKKEIWVRRLPALDFIDETVGRAAEMGKPVVVNIGGGGAQEATAPMTVAGLSVLGYVGRLCARHGVELVVPIQSATNFPMAQEVLKTSYSLEGKSEEFETRREEIVRWVPVQAALVALGQSLKPAAHIMVGPFWHESVQIAEMYGRLGAVQIGGTARLMQIPFFAGVCDMMLIGEEIFCVGAYLSRSVPMIGSLAAEDWFKVAAIALSILGIILATMGPSALKPLLDLWKW